MNVFNMGGRRSMAAGVVVSLASAVVPVVLGTGATPAELDLVDGMAWLANEADGTVVRVNGETGRVDARVDAGETLGALAVEQADGVVLVGLGDEIRSIDLANLDWGASAEAHGAGLFVGDGASYTVTLDGTVRQLDPATLRTVARVELGATPAAPAVVVDSRLVVPLGDGTVDVVDGDEVTAEIDAGDPGDELRVTRVGHAVSVLNVSEGSLRRLDPGSGDVREPVTVDLPGGEIVVPTELPGGRLWVLAPRTGELVGIGVRTGRVRTAQVTAARHDVTAPVSVDGRVYLVDRTSGEIVAVDAGSLDVVRREALGLDDASRVELLAEGGKAFVNDRGGRLAVVIDGDEYRRVDKYRDDGVPADTSPSQVPEPDPGAVPPPALSPAPPQPPSGPPPPPAAVEAVAGNGAATVSWIPGRGDNAPSAYHVTYPGLPAPIDVPGGQLSVPVDGLHNGATYTFQVWASNERGESPRVASNPVVPNDEVPGAPGRVEARSEASREATVSWSPADGRGNDIDRYIVVSTPAGITAEVGGDRTEATVGNLTDDTTYTFVVMAVNGLGNQGEPSGPSNAVTPYGPPGAIPAVTRSEGDGTVTLEWEPAPSRTEVTYLLASSPAAGGPASTGDASVTYTGLTNGTSYRFTIVPTNDRGDGPPSTVQATPGTQPTVNGVTATRTGDRSFQVAYDVDTGGRPIESCTVTPSGGASQSCEAGSGAVAVDVPMYNTAYTFTVTVTSSLGEGSTTSPEARSDGKPLVVDAYSQNRWDGALCTWQGHEGTRPYYAEPRHTCTSEQGYIPDGTTVRALCWTPGGEINDDLYNYSSTWVRVEQGYMNTLYFENWASNPESNLPRC